MGHWTLQEPLDVIGKLSLATSRLCLEASLLFFATDILEVKCEYARRVIFLKMEKIGSNWWLRLVGTLGLEHTVLPCHLLNQTDKTWYPLTTMSLFCLIRLTFGSEDPAFMYVHSQITVGKAGLEDKAQGRLNRRIFHCVFGTWQIWCVNWSRSLSFLVPQFTLSVKWGQLYFSTSRGGMGGLGWQVSHFVNITNMSLDLLVARAVYNVRSGWCCVNNSDCFPMLTKKLLLLKQPHGHDPCTQWAFTSCQLQEREAYCTPWSLPHRACKGVPTPIWGSGAWTINIT